jgi:hypothetical protein
VENKGGQTPILIACRSGFSRDSLFISARVAAKAAPTT